MKKFRFSKTVFLTGLVSVVVIGLLFFSYSSVIVQVSGRGVAWVSSWISKPFGSFRQVETDFSNLFYAYEENKELKKRLYAMDEEVNQVDRLKKENDELREQLGLQSQFKDRKVLQADVVDRLPATWSHQLLINKGKKDQVSEGMFVVAHGGLVGQIQEVSEETSTVALLTSEEEPLAIPVKIQAGSKDLFGVVESYDAEKQILKINQLNGNDEIPKGARVMTSGLGKITVKDVPVGQVESSKENTNNLERVVNVKLAASSLDFSTVSVVGP